MSFITGRAAVVVACSRSEPALFGARIFTTASSFCPWTRVLRPDTDADADADPDADPDPPPPSPLPRERTERGRGARAHNDVSRSYGDSGTRNFLRPTPRHETRGRYSSDKGSRLNLAKLVPSLFPPPESTAVVVPPRRCPRLYSFRPTSTEHPRHLSSDDDSSGDG